MMKSGRHQQAMSENSTSASREDAGSDRKSSEQPAEAPSTPSQAAVERPSLFERLTTFFRPRNGSSLREDIADALAETGTDEATFSPAERAMLNNILRFREVRVE